MGGVQYQSPGIPVGGSQPRRVAPTQNGDVHFAKFVCRNERISTLRGGRAPAAPPGSATALLEGWNPNLLM